MDPRVERFRELAKQRSGAQANYPKAAKELALEVAQEHLAGGASLSTVAGVLGIAGTTLGAWLGRHSSTAGMVPVRLKKAPVYGSGAGGLRLQTPTGYVVEGLSDLQSVVHLVKSLG